jgi:hypothetical protein
MSVQDDKTAGQEDDTAGREDDKAHEDDNDRADGDQQLTEKPEPDDDAKEKAAEMMTAYEDKPTLVLPGSGGAVSGTAIGAWLDDDGNPKHSEDSDRDDEDKQEQVDKDKTLNDELRKLASEENKGEKRGPGGK